MTDDRISSAFQYVEICASVFLFLKIIKKSYKIDKVSTYFDNCSWITKYIDGLFSPISSGIGGILLLKKITKERWMSYELGWYMGLD